MASGTQTIDGFLKPKGFQQITSLAASTALTVPDGTQLALIQCETQNVRWRDDGNAPTTSVGMLMTTSSDVLIYNGSLLDIRFIEVSASAKLNVAYYG